MYPKACPLPAHTSEHLTLFNARHEEWTTTVSVTTQHGSCPWLQCLGNSGKLTSFSVPCSSHTKVECNVHKVRRFKTCTTLAHALYCYSKFSFGLGAPTFPNIWWDPIFILFRTWKSCCTPGGLVFRNEIQCSSQRKNGEIKHSNLPFFSGSKNLKVLLVMFFQVNCQLKNF